MKKISIVAVSLLALAACSQKETLSQDGPEADLKVAINPEIIASKVTGTRFDSNDKIGLDIRKDAETTDYITNAELTYDGSAFSGKDLIWYKGETASTLTAYYPYSASGRPSNWKVATDQSAGYSAYDILGAVTHDATPSETAISMKFYHLMSKITVTIDNQATTERSVSAITLKGIIPDGALDFANLNSAASGTAADFTPYKNGGVYELLVPAQTVVVTCSALLSDGSTLENTASSISLKSGCIHNMTVTVTDKDLTAKFTGDIEDWTVENEFVFE